jgi:CBS domain-containing protein
MTAQQALGSRAYDLESALVAHAMHAGVVTCFRDTSLVSAAHMMATERVHCLVVVADMDDGRTKLWGVLSDRDVLATAVRGDTLEATAGTCAATELVTVIPEDDLIVAAERMNEHGVTHIVVVDPETGDPIGVLSALDIAAVVGRIAPIP